LKLYRQRGVPEAQPLSSPNAPRRETGAREQDFYIAVTTN
jgi:hypothetical protein